MLPPNWQATELGNVVVLSTESASATSLPPETLYVGLEHIESNTTRLLGSGNAGGLKSNVRLFRRGDVLYGTLRPYLNKVCVPDFDGVCSMEILVFTQSISLHNRFLLYLLNSPSTVAFATGASRGTNLPRVNYGSLASMPIWLPPVPEQARIAAKLDGVLGRIYAAQERLASVIELVRHFRAAALAAAYRVWQTSARTEVDQADLPVLPSGWRWRSAKDIVDADITYGIVQPGPRLAVGIPYVSSQDIADDGIRIAELARTSPTIAAAYQRSALRRGDILLGIIRNIKVATVPLELEGANISRSVARLRPGSDIDSEYLAAWLRSPFAQSWLQARARGIDMPVINLRDVRELPVPVAPHPVQQQITAQLREAFGTADAFGARIAESRTSLDRLHRELMKLAITGRLLPQDSDDRQAPLFTRDERDAIERETRSTPKVRRTAMRSKPRTRQSISQVLRENGAMSPEDVLTTCGYDVESIDDFFADLRREVLAGSVVQQRDNGHITLSAGEDEREA